MSDWDDSGDDEPVRAQPVRAPRPAADDDDGWGGGGDDDGWDDDGSPEVRAAARAAPPASPDAGEDSDDSWDPDAEEALEEEKRRMKEEEERLAKEKKEEEEEKKRLEEERKAKAKEAYVPLADATAEKLRQRKMQEDADGADDLFAGFTVKETKEETVTKKKTEEKKEKTKIEVIDDFEKFHLETQADCEEFMKKICGKDGKLDKVSNKSFMKGCNLKFLQALLKLVGPDLALKDIEALEKHIGADLKKKRVAKTQQQAEKAGRGRRAIDGNTKFNIKDELNDVYGDDDDWSEGEWGEGDWGTGGGAAGAEWKEGDGYWGEDGAWVEGTNKTKQPAAAAAAKK